MVRIMYYKVIKNNRVIDVLDRLIYLKYQPKHNIMVLCTESEAQAILSSDGNTIWHESSLYKIPIDGYDEVEILPISQYEYKQLKVLNMQSPEEILDQYTELLLEMGVI